MTAQHREGHARAEPRRLLGVRNVARVELDQGAAGARPGVAPVSPARRCGSSSRQARAPRRRSSRRGAGAQPGSATATCASRSSCTSCRAPRRGGRPRRRSRPSGRRLRAAAAARSELRRARARRAARALTRGGPARTCRAGRRPGRRAGRRGAGDAGDGERGGDAPDDDCRTDGGRAAPSGVPGVLGWSARDSTVPRARWATVGARYALAVGAIARAGSRTSNTVRPGRLSTLTDPP